jgi:hypothetical protein
MSTNHHVALICHLAHILHRGLSTTIHPLLPTPLLSSGLPEKVKDMSFLIFHTLRLVTLQSVRTSLVFFVSVFKPVPELVSFVHIHTQNPAYITTSAFPVEYYSEIVMHHITQTSVQIFTFFLHCVIIFFIHSYLRTK